MPEAGGRADDLVPRSRRLADLAQRRLALEPRAALPRERARQLRDHVESFILPRAADLDAPLLVVLMGPTGAGKSSILNAVAGAPVSRAGVLRPTTREAVLYADRDDAAMLRAEGRLRLVPPDRLIHVAAPGSNAGVAIVDAPDIDSIERDNRALAETLLEACDLCVFVTTATRYADLVPWEVLHRIRQREVPLMIVLNRLPADPRDREVVLTDAARLLAEHGLRQASGKIDLIAIDEGQLDVALQGVSRVAIAALRERIERLASTGVERRQLAADALAGAIRGLSPLVVDVATDLESDAVDSEALRGLAQSAYDEESAALARELRSGVLLRAEVLRQWHDFVGADQIARFMSSGLARIRGLLLLAIRGTPVAPVASVEEDMASSLEALTLRHASEAARRTAERWSERRDAGALLDGDATLWSASPQLAPAVRDVLRDWMHAVIDDVRAASGRKHAVARVAAIGVNAVGVAVMLGVFAHTAGITGAEVGIAAGTAFLNQKLLEAIFGERAMEELVERAGRRLDEALAKLFLMERERFDAIVPDPGALRELAADLRSGVADLSS
ncbi:MAG TPA: GTPase domain-containing protein [Candidatus Limnocylindria bacterium]|nr:GTPase domain-containing protein [Candidatus Limnocylindria bacterium]